MTCRERIEWCDVWVEAGLSQALDLFAAHRPYGKVILATSTPVWSEADSEAPDSKANRVRERNRIAAALAADRDIPVNDLHAAVIGHPEYFSKDGVHFLESGQAVLGRLVADAILAETGGLQLAVGAWPMACGGASTGR